MSHIPPAAMPHAKPHERAPQESAPAAPPPRGKRGTPLPWAALAAGGVLAIGGAVAATLLLRGRSAAEERASTSRSTAKTGRRKSRTAKPRKSKTTGSDAG